MQHGATVKKNGKFPRSWYTYEKIHSLATNAT